MAENATRNLLTDGSGISDLTKSKLAKDLIADFLLSGAAALAAVQIMSLQAAIDAPHTAVFAVAGALIRVLYRTVLKWATS